jgi:hypothetical protein
MSELIAALNEAGVVRPAVPDVPRVLLHSVARAIVEERVEPIRAADWLWHLSISLDSHDDQFDPFVYAASEAPDRPDERDLFVRMVRMAAAEIVGRGA